MYFSAGCVCSYQNASLVPGLSIPFHSSVYIHRRVKSEEA